MKPISLVTLALAAALLAGCSQPKQEPPSLGAAASHATGTTPGTQAAPDAADPEPVPSPSAPVR